MHHDTPLLRRHGAPHDKRDWADIRRDWLAINYHGLTLDSSEDSPVDRLSHEPPTAAGRKLAVRFGSWTKISVREFLTGTGREPPSPAADPAIGQESEGFRDGSRSDRDVAAWLPSRLTSLNPRGRKRPAKLYQRP